MDRSFSAKAQLRPGGRLVWALLAASFALNICFILGVLYYRSLATDPAAMAERRAQAVAEILALDDAQLAALRALQRQVASERRAMRSGMEPIRSGFLDALARPELDEAALADLLEQRGDLRRPHLLAIARGLHGFLQELTPEQRERLLVMAEERGFLRGFLGNPER